MKFSKEQIATSTWFRELRDLFIKTLEQIEKDYDPKSKHKFIIKPWDKGKDEGGGEMAIMRGQVFEKIGVNISTVYGNFSKEFRTQIPGAEETGEFFATGISFVAHPYNPFVPISHFNTRFITTTKKWFGGGGDLTPIFPLQSETNFFHKNFENTCNKHDAKFYPEYKKWCDEYFFIKHRNEARGVGGIFYDYLYSETNQDFVKNFAFTRDVGTSFLSTYADIVRSKMNHKFSDADKEVQFKKRSRYAEFNMIYDRGTKFGLATGGNVEAIFMSMPPVAKWE
ncbi:MAG: oxygen-dependent coproporphyrinogen oxidase [Alphaproteobacteria bacterium]